MKMNIPMIARDEIKNENLKLSKYNNSTHKKIQQLTYNKNSLPIDKQLPLDQQIYFLKQDRQSFNKYIKNIVKKYDILPSETEEPENLEDLPKEIQDLLKPNQNKISLQASPYATLKNEIKVLENTKQICKQMLANPEININKEKYETEIKK